MVSEGARHCTVISVGDSPVVKASYGFLQAGQEPASGSGRYDTVAPAVNRDIGLAVSRLPPKPHTGTYLNDQRRQLPLPPSCYGRALTRKQLPNEPEAATNQIPS